MSGEGSVLGVVCVTVCVFVVCIVRKAAHREIKSLPLAPWEKWGVNLGEREHLYMCLSVCMNAGRHFHVLYEIF